VPAALTHAFTVFCLFVCLHSPRQVGAEAVRLRPHVEVRGFGGFMVLSWPFVPRAFVAAYRHDLGGPCMLGLRGLVYMGRLFRSANRLMLLLVLADEC
jgi:hypothetical protein